MKKLLLLIFNLIFQVLNAQEVFEIGRKYEIHSAILNEGRNIWVHLPKDYPLYDSQKYSVIYLLDGETQFQQVVATQQFLSKGMYASIPQMIVVGINNTDRTHDLTPTNAPIQRIERKGASFGTSGGADKFHGFLEHELIPYIEKEFRTNGFRILVGHSFGGLFAIHSLLTKDTNPFNAFIAIDPSLWWDNNKLLTESNELLKTKNLKDKTLFVAKANNPPTHRDTSTNHPRAIQHFVKAILPNTQANNLRWSWKYYEADDHGTVVQPAVSDGLRYLFEGLQLEVKDVPYTPKIVEEQYKKVSAKIGFLLRVDLGLLNALQVYCKSQGFDESIKELEKLKN